MQNLKNKPGNMLMDALDFDEDDLQANRNGQLGESQYDYLFSQRMVFKTVSIAIFLLALFVIILLLFGNALIPGLMLFAMTVAIISFMQMKQRQFDNDLQGKVLLLEGTVKLDIIGEKTYAIYVEGYEFNVNKKAFLSFKNGDPYRIYFTRRTRQIPSAEWLYDVQDDNFLED